MGNACIFTIVSRNYLHYARTLMAGVEQFAPGADRLVGLCDERGDFDFSEENFDLLELRELEIPQIEKFIFRYTILELNTAIKPYIISALFQRGYEKVIYFDPDIRIYRSLDGMLSLLDEHQMLLIPDLLEQVSIFRVHARCRTAAKQVFAHFISNSSHLITVFFRVASCEPCRLTVYYVFCLGEIL
jgi:hypothetical protein